MEIRPTATRHVCVVELKREDSAQLAAAGANYPVASAPRIYANYSSEDWPRGGEPVIDESCATASNIVASQLRCVLLTSVV